jgi:LysM repeat protein
MPIRKAITLFLMLFVLAGSFFFVAPQVTRAECGVYHTVTAGQNLFRISLRYGVSMHDIAAVNGIRDIKVIYTGESLFIPCFRGTGQSQYPVAGTPFYVVPTGSPYTYIGTGTPQPSTIVDAPIYETVNCTGFRATSPLDGLLDGTNTFYWDAPTSVDIIAIYQVVILDDRGARVATFSAGSQTLRTQGDVGFNAIGGRSRFSWYVTALVNGNETCRTQVTTLPRAWNDNAGLSPSL